MESQGIVNLDQVRALIEKEFQSKSVITSKVMQQFAQIAGKVFIQLQNENKKEKLDTSSDQYWQEYGNSFVCTPCSYTPLHRPFKIPKEFSGTINIRNYRYFYMQIHI